MLRRRHCRQTRQKLNVRHRTSDFTVSCVFWPHLLYHLDIRYSCGYAWIVMSGKGQKEWVNIVFRTCQQVFERNIQKNLLQSQTSLIGYLDLEAYYWICLGLTIKWTCGRELGIGNSTTWWSNTSYDESYLSDPAHDDKFAVDWVEFRGVHARLGYPTYSSRRWHPQIVPVSDWDPTLSWPMTHPSVMPCGRSS